MPYKDFLVNQRYHCLAVRGNLTTAQAASVAGVNPSTWSFWENERAGATQKVILRFRKKAKRMFPGYRSDLVQMPRVDNKEKL